MAVKEQDALVKITINLRASDVAYAKRVARDRGVLSYQQVIRGWVADGVDRAETRK